MEGRERWEARGIKRGQSEAFLIVLFLNTVEVWVYFYCGKDERWGSQWKWRDAMIRIRICLNRRKVLRYEVAWKSLGRQYSCWRKQGVDKTEMAAISLHGSAYWQSREWQICLSSHKAALFFFIAFIICESEK